MDCCVRCLTLLDCIFPIGCSDDCKEVDLRQKASFAILSFLRQKGDGYISAL